ncbi:meteorin-like protein [Branchiostoma floridae]|uniref:Meteorin-like protein n=1 Tax=Branchiostoma floridae TaxID=7739 RepID=A0A9J7M659_BRAFL|nr:meteorin-like protein [Branchiostoma floridae]
MRPLRAASPAATTLLLWTFWLGASATRYSEDQCDWTGSGLSQLQESKSVQQVYFRCVEGTLQWKYPRGALRIVLEHGTSGRDFKGCVQADRTFSGANVYLEEDEKLKLIIQDGESSDNLERLRCFSSKEGRTALYVEAAAHLSGAESVVKRVVALKYELQLVTHRHFGEDDFKECRPCNDTELMTAFCSSDFVVKARIKSVTNNADTKESTLELSASQVLRQKETIFVENGHGHGHHHGLVRTPLKCGVQQGEGQFLITGSIHFGKARLGCAPRFKEFKKLAEYATRTGRNMCNMEEVMGGKDDL